ncbi:MAG TPA: glutamic-type intramembrane protease, partial [Labilithrix sp.]
MIDRRALIEALVASVVVTAAVTAASAALPDKYVATAVGFVFLGATWLLVWRRDDAHVERAGLALGGLVLPGKIDQVRLAGAVGRAIGWAALLSILFFVP